MGMGIRLACVMVVVLSVAAVVHAAGQKPRRVAHTAKATSRPATAPADTSATARKNIEKARQHAWNEFSVIYGKVQRASSEKERDELTAAAAKKVPQWYAGLDIKAPDTKSEWIGISFMDLLPEDGLQELRAKLQSDPHFKAFAAELKIPDNPTRRDLAGILYSSGPCKTSSGTVFPAVLVHVTEDGKFERVNPTSASSAPGSTGSPATQTVLVPH